MYTHELIVLHFDLLTIFFLGGKIPGRVTAPRFELTHQRARMFRGYQLNHRGDRLYDECFYVCMVITYSKVWINRVKLPIVLVVNCRRGNKCFPLAVRAWEFGLVRQIRPPCPASACSFSARSEVESGAYLRDSSRFPRRRPFIYIANRHHRVSPELTRSRNRVPMAFTAKSPPAQGHKSPRSTYLLLVDG